jgi:hypothetical protein
MSNKDSKRKKNYANLQKGKRYFDLFPSGVVYKGKAGKYKGIKSLGPKKN